MDHLAVDVVLPCLDEAEALPWVLSRMPPWARPIVADNGSSDGSADIARAHGARVVDVPRRGYGAACHAGLEAATSDLVAFMDADASLDPAELTRLLGVLEVIGDGRGDTDAAPTMVVGARVPVSREAFPWHLRLANREVARRLRRRTRLTLRDIGPMRLAPRAALLDLPIVDRRSGYPLETVLRAAQAGWTVLPADVTYRPRAGRSKVTGTPLGVARAVRDMSRVLS